MFQAAELAEFTAKIALLEEAKKKKEEEASEWQHKVMSSFCVKSELQTKGDECVNPTGSPWDCISPFGFREAFLKGFCSPVY